MKKVEVLQTVPEQESVMENVGGSSGKRALIRVVINGKFCREALIDTRATMNMCSKGHAQ